MRGTIYLLQVIVFNKSNQPIMYSDNYTVSPEQDYEVIQ